MSPPFRAPRSRSRQTPPTRGKPVRERVFVSHASKNSNLVVAVTAELEVNGTACWISTRDIRPGYPNYGLAILEGLSVCQAVVLLLTESSNRS